MMKLKIYQNFYKTVKTKKIEIKRTMIENEIQTTKRAKFWCFREEREKKKKKVHRHKTELLLVTRVAPTTQQRVFLDSWRSRMCCLKGADASHTPLSAPQAHIHFCFVIYPNIKLPLIWLCNYKKKKKTLGKTKNTSSQVYLFLF